jgi:hypothetical protein
MEIDIAALTYTMLATTVVPYSEKAGKDAASLEQKCFA